MDLQRSLIIALIIVSFIIWRMWEQDKNLQFQRTSTQVETTSTLNKNAKTISNNHANGKKITIITDVLKLIVNTRGGDIEKALLLLYSKELKSREPFQLLETTPEFIYQAQSGLTGPDGPDNPQNGIRPLYSVNKNVFVLSKHQKKISVPLSYRDTNGNIFTKTFFLERNNYAVDVNFSIQNTSKKSLILSIFGQLKQSINIRIHDNTKSNDFSSYGFRGAAYSTINEKYKKYKFDTIADNKHLNINSKEGWVAMLQQYFATAWIPRNSYNNYFYTSNIENDIAVIGYKSQLVFIKPGQIKQLKSTLWIGPKIQDKMASTAPYLDLTIDYGWLWFISHPLFKLLKFIHSFLGNWGFSIIAITFIVRGFMYPLTKIQYISMAKMHILQPKIQTIYNRLGNDKNRISQEMFALYKKEKVNPLGGCLPILVQMPIFLALYYMLIGSVELRHSPFILWIYDLSEKDPYYILPIFMGITMFFIQKTSRTNNTNNPVQNKIFSFIPLIFTVFFLWFPSGLVLYYIVSNLVTIAQQKLIFHNLEKKGYA